MAVRTWIPLFNPALGTVEVGVGVVNVLFGSLLLHEISHLAWTCAANRWRINNGFAPNAADPS